MKRYFYSDGKEKNGPFSFEELKNEEINPDTLIWFEGLEEWTFAKYIKEIEEILILSPPPLEEISSVQSTSIPPPLPITQSIEKEKEFVNQHEPKNNSIITIKKEKKKIDKTLATILAAVACVVVYFVWFALWYIIANAVFGWRNINEGGALVMVTFFATLVLLWRFTWKKIRGLS